MEVLHTATVRKILRQISNTDLAGRFDLVLFHYISLFCQRGVQNSASEFPPSCRKLTVWFTA